jgi:mevalonate kinase
MQKKASEVRVSAPGKIILTGEHAVVYGHPAILAAVDKRLVIEGRRVNGQTKVKVLKSEIPIGAGMGSSAALSVAAAAAETVLRKKKWDLDNINSIAYESEKKYHGNPSGGDNTIVTYGNFLWYRKETESFKIFRRIIPKIKLPDFFLVNSGIPKEATGEMVAKVADLYSKNPQKINRILTKIEIVTRKFLNLLIDGNGDWGELINENEKYLELLGVVSKTGRNLIRGIKKIGGAAKVSGAGGTTNGSGIILIYHLDEKKLRDFCESNNLEILPVKLGEEGVRIEK